jgi:hypothetical protein
MPYRRTLAVITFAALSAGALGTPLPAGAQRPTAPRPIALVRPSAVVRVIPGDSDAAYAQVAIAYRAPELTEQLTLEILDARGRRLISWGGRDGTPLPAADLDSVSWNLRYPGVPGADSGAAWVPGPLAPPGRYLVRLSAGTAVDSTTLVIKPNPRAAASRTDYGEQLAFQLRVRDRLAQATSLLRTARSVRGDVAERRELLPDSLRQRYDLIVGVLGPRVTAVESDLRQRGGTGITNLMVGLLNESDHIDGHPTDAQYSVFMQQQIRLDIAAERLHGELANLLPYVNATLAMAGIDPVPPSPTLATR